MSQRIERLLDESKLASPVTPLTVTARVTPSSQGFRLDLTLGSPSAVRSRALLAPSCAELAHATALVVALAIDPTLTAEASPDGSAALANPNPPAQCPGLPQISVCELPPQAPTIPVRAAPITTAPKAAAAEVAPRRLSPYALLAGSRVAFGALPEPLPGVTLGGVYRNGSHWLELSASGAFAVAGPRSDGTGASFLLGFLAPRYCGRVPAALGTVGACALLEIGASRASGFGVEYPNTHWSSWVAPGVALEASLPLSSVAELSLMGDLLFVATRTRFELDGALRYRPNLLVPAVRLVLAAGL